MKIYAQNFVTPTNQTTQFTKSKNKIQTTSQPVIENDLNKIPYNYNNITFGSNSDVIAKIEKLVKSKNYQNEDLYKLFNELDEIAQNHVKKRGKIPRSIFLKF